ncbi:MAG: HAD family hydrolase [Candidatus Binatia bacterium]
MLRAFLFDFDGTIADTEPLHFAAFAEVLGRRGIELSEATYYERYLSLTDRECLELALADAERRDLAGEIPALLREKAQAMAGRLAADVPLCPGVEGFLVEASTIGPLGIVSGALRREACGVLERAGLSRYFAAVVTAEDVTAGKPDPEGYRLGWRRLRRELADLEPPECLAIEDSPKGVEAARAAGLATLAIPHTRPASELALADVVAPSYAAIDWRALRARFG